MSTPRNPLLLEVIRAVMGGVVQHITIVITLTYLMITHDSRHTKINLKVPNLVLNKMMNGVLMFLKTLSYSTGNH